MSALSVKQQIIDKLDRMTLAQQQRVLVFSSHLTRPQGESGEDFLERTHDVRIPPEDIEALRSAIEECRRINGEDWLSPSPFD